MFFRQKPRTKFGKYIDKYGLKQKAISQLSKVAESTISELCYEKERIPNYRTASKIIKALKELGHPRVKHEDFWEL